MNALQIERALRWHLDHTQCLLIPQADVSCSVADLTYWNGRRGFTYIADLMRITDAGYATEIEIKISRADWIADAKKEKWTALPPWISQFVYCVPHDLKEPPGVNPLAGIWRVSPRNYGGGVQHFIDVERAPKRIGKEKVPADVRERWLRNMYYRYWNQRRLDIDRQLESMERRAA